MSEDKWYLLKDFVLSKGDEKRVMDIIFKKYKNVHKRGVADCDYITTEDVSIRINENKKLWIEVSMTTESFLNESLRALVGIVKNKKLKS